MTIPPLRLLHQNLDDTVGVADYCWIEDGVLYSRTRVIPVGRDTQGQPNTPVLEPWVITQDNKAQIVLSPCHFLPDPFRPQPSFVVLCETRDLADNPLADNLRVRLRQVGDSCEGEPWWGFKQEYKVTRMTNFPEGHLWKGAAEQHLLSCLDAGVLIHSSWWAADQGWFSIGPRGLANEVEEQRPTALVACDHLWIARFFLHKILRSQGLIPTYSGLTIYLSSARTRDQASSQEAESLRDRLLQALSLQSSNIEVCASTQPRGFPYIALRNIPHHTDPYGAIAWVLNGLELG